MPIQAIEPRRLYRQIAEQLRALIGGGEFALGTRLPTERALAAQLGVSRPSVREALIALEVEGLVEVRMGSGIYVTASESAPSARRIESALGPFNIIRARQLIESELAAVAARQRPAATLRQLRASLRMMGDDIERGVMPIRGDREFHLAIAEACDNSALLRVVTDLFDERHNPLFERLGHHFENAQSWRAAVAEHRAVLDAITERDADAARGAMLAHLQNSHDRFAAAWAAAKPARRGARERVAA